MNASFPNLCTNLDNHNMILLVFRHGYEPRVYPRQQRSIGGLKIRREWPPALHSGAPLEALSRVSPESYFG